VEALQDMAGRVPARREVKKKPKATSDKQPKLESLSESSSQSVELIKPKRKPRTEKDVSEE
jgi:hypothetical protein